MQSRGGYAKAVNAGLQRTTGNYVLLLNNDVVFQQTDWLERMWQTAESAWNIGIVGCRLLYPDKTIQHAGGKLLPGQLYEHLYRYMPENFPGAELIYDVESVTGALMLVKRKVIDEIGFLNEEYLLSHEDVDYCLHARQAGWRVVYCGSAVAVHDEGSTRGKNRKDKPDPWYYEELQSYTKFWLKWKNHHLARPLPQLHLIFVLEMQFYHARKQTVDSLIAGLQEQGCKVQSILTENKKSYDRLSNRQCFKQDEQYVIFTNERGLPIQVKNKLSMHIPVLFIEKNGWNQDPYPQNVHRFLNLASIYIKSSK